jgi:hypothetical protein
MPRVLKAKEALFKIYKFANFLKICPGAEGFRDLESTTQEFGHNAKK